MVTVSPPVSPSVVAAILMTQNASVTSGTLLREFVISVGIPLSPGPVEDVRIVHRNNLRCRDNRYGRRRFSRCGHGEAWECHAGRTFPEPIAEMAWQKYFEIANDFMAMFHEARPATEMCDDRAH